MFINYFFLYLDFLKHLLSSFFEYNHLVTFVYLYFLSKKNNHFNFFDLGFLFLLPMSFSIIQYFILYHFLYQMIKLYLKKNHDAID